MMLFDFLRFAFYKNNNKKLFLFLVIFEIVVDIRADNIFLL